MGVKYKDCQSVWAERLALQDGLVLVTQEHILRDTKARVFPLLSRELEIYD